MVNKCKSDVKLGNLGSPAHYLASYQVDDKRCDFCFSFLQLGRGGKSDWQILRSVKEECRTSCSKPLLSLSHWYAALLRLTQHCCQWVTADQFCVLFMSFDVVVAVNAWATKLLCIAARSRTWPSFGLCMWPVSPASADMQQTHWHQLHMTSGLVGPLLLLACRRPAVVRLRYTCSWQLSRISHSSQPADSLRPAYSCNSLRGHLISHR